MAIDFSKQINKPLYIELYAVNPGPKIKNLLAAMIAVSDYVEGIILATHDPKWTIQIQENILNNREHLLFLEKSSRQQLIEIVDSWESHH